jgi:membrane protease YdiL (CAAX protease family)
MVTVAFTEELMFRGYILGNLMQSMNKWLALILSSLVFAVVHVANPDIGFIPVLNIFLAGIFLGLNFLYTKNLWYSIALHFSWNFMQGPILGYDVSGYKLQGFFSQTITGPTYITGGEFGFEGSVVCSALLIIATLILYYIFERRYIATTL